jgi:Cu/Ag efflux protein CusF
MKGLSMKRTLLLATALALVAAAPVLAHEAPHESNGGTISEITPTSITIQGKVSPLTSAGDVMTCAVNTRSPSVRTFKVGAKVYAKCDWLDAQQTLIAIRAFNPAVRKFAGSIKRMSRTSITVRTSKGLVKASVPKAKVAKLRGMKVGHKVTLSVRKVNRKWVLVDLQHAGHAHHP